MTALGWTAQYYDAIEYYFWGPDKLNAVRRPGSSTTAGAVIDRLKRLEEPLNHLLTLFLDLAPSALKRELAQACNGLDVGAASTVADRSTHGTFGGLNVAQPDILISGPAGLLAIEVKLGSPSDLGQVLKYALLLSKLSQGRQCGLTYLTQRPFARHWRGPSTPDEVKAAALAHLLSVERLGQVRIGQAERAEIARSLEGLQLTAWRFADLDRLLARWADTPSDTPAGETLVRLCSGLRGELAARGLVEG